ncbi:hypothetical protein GCM10023191_001330 [Actinoallomurus oryzae]|uniref:Uncharacterized protein n=1 Tax=Actinoallomurus oryzae TaxID=502180 RepID=A0ABP8P4H5_9ACTN
MTPAGATYGINRDFEERYPLAYVEEMEAAPAPGSTRRPGPRPSPFRRWGEVTLCKARRCN